MEKTVKLSEIRNLIREAAYRIEEYPEEFEEFKGGLGNDAMGLDYPVDDDERDSMFDDFMSKKQAPSAQSQVGYEDANNEDEIGDSPRYSCPELDGCFSAGEDFFSSLRGMGFNLNESQIKEIARNTSARVIKELKKRGYK